MAERNLSLDLIKICAMFGVIALHTFEASFDWRVANIFYETSVIAIPLFFMTSGYLLLGRENINTAYICRKTYRIVRLIVALNVAYWTLTFIKGHQFDFKVLVENLIGSFIQSGVFSRCWYLGAMIIIFFFLPFINMLYRFHKKSFAFMFFFLFIITVFVFSDNLGGGIIEQTTIQTFRLWNWLFYFCCGGAVKYLQEKTTFSIPLFDLIVMVIINIIYQELFKTLLNTKFCEFFYSSIVTIILVLFFFCYTLHVKISNNRFKSIIKAFSPLFLIVYLFHGFVTMFVNKYLMPTLPESVIPYYLFFSVSILSVIVSWGINKVPVVRRLFVL